MTPLVSVVIPVYNAEQYLPEALSDLLNQTLREAEFIFVDDGSTDSSLKILQEEAKKDSRIRILHQEHKFAGCARNLGMEAAKGKYFIALDADDRFEHNLLELSVNRAEETNAEIVIFDADRLIMSLNKFIPDSVFLIAKDLPTNNFNPNEENEAVFRLMVTWNKLYKLSWLKENNFAYQNTYECNDVLFTFLTLACSKNVIALPNVLVHYRKGDKFNIQSNKDSHPLDGGRAFLVLKEELISRGIFSEFKNLFYSVAVRVLLGSRFSTFSTIEGAEAFFYNLKNIVFKELGLDAYNEIDFVGNDSNILKDRVAKFDSLTFVEWMFFELHRYKTANEKNFYRYLDNKKKVSTLQKQNKKYAEDYIKLKNDNKKIKELNNAIRSSFSFKIGLLLTFPIRMIMRCVHIAKK